MFFGYDHEQVKYSGPNILSYNLGEKKNYFSYSEQLGSDHDLAQIG